MYNHITVSENITFGNVNLSQVSIGVSRFSSVYHSTLPRLLKSDASKLTFFHQLLVTSSFIETRFLTHIEGTLSTFLIVVFQFSCFNSIETFILYVFFSLKSFIITGVNSSLVSPSQKSHIYLDIFEELFSSFFA
jgi:hypothetical protein